MSRVPLSTRLYGLPPRYRVEGTNPGGWPTGPLESESQCHARDVSNAGADLWEAIEAALTPALGWLSRRLVRR